MFEFLLNPWKAGVAVLGLALIVVGSWGWRVDSLRADHLAAYDKLHGEAGAVLASTKLAADNPALTWDGAAAQITELGGSIASLKGAVVAQNVKLDSMAAETLRLQAAGNDLRSQLATAQSARASYAARLDALAAAPGDHTSCPALLSQTADALDLAWSSGL